MTPIFHQAWHLFAPDPPLKEKALQYRVKTQEGWSAWIAPASDLLLAHDRWRLGNANIRYRMHQNAAYRLWAEQEIADDNTGGKGDFNVDQYLRNSRGMTTARHYVLQHFFQHSDAIDADSVAFRLLINIPPPFPKKDGNWSQQVFDLPIVPVRE